MSKDFKNRDFKFVGSTICLCLHEGNRYGQLLYNHMVKK
jgi:3-methyladenine DNA glycosylase Tag